MEGPIEPYGCREISPQNAEKTLALLTTRRTFYGERLREKERLEKGRADLAGTLIGIISHVPALKERIGAQIRVEVGNGGRSSLSGPGCRRISG
jgi:hypothetical protein